MSGHVRIKRIYDAPSESDGQRVLVDRIWPRGMKRESAALDAWLSEIAPTTALRKWFGHDPARWQEFQKRYRKELDENPDGLAKLCALVDQGDVTLLYAARDTEHNDAVVLADYLGSKA